MSERETKYDRLLQEFLDEQHGQRLRGITLEALHAKVDRLHSNQAKLASAIFEAKADQARYSRRVRTLESQVSLLSARSEAVPDWHPDPAEVTGTHQFHEAQRKMRDQIQVFEDERDRRRDSSTWWRRKRREWIVAALGFAAALFLTSLIGGLAFFLSRALGGK